MQHVTIFRDSGRYAGWPANYGIWSWEKEIVLGFVVGFPGQSAGLHSRDKSRPFVNVQARSLDGGLTWQIEDFPGHLPGGRGLSADEHVNDEISLAAALATDPPAPLPGGINFAHPELALMCARTGLQPGARSLLYVSYDRCRTWAGPYGLPMFGQPGVQARTDYVVLDQASCLLFLTVAKEDGREGRVICVRTTDGGKSFHHLADVGGVPAGPDGFSIMPATAQLPGGRLLTALRCRGGDRAAGQDQHWLDLYISEDLGRSWQFYGRPQTFQQNGHNGNPGTLDLLPDGRLLLTYGNRDEPYTIGARLSADLGQSWGEEITLRTGGGNRDIGYPRTAVLPDGTAVTAYYFNDEPGGSGPRYIEATVWRP